MIRFGFSSISKSSACFVFQLSNTKLPLGLLRPFSCSSQSLLHFNDPTIKSTNQLCSSQGLPFGYHYNPVLHTNNNNRVFHTMNVSRSQNKEKSSSPSSDDQSSSSSSSGDHLNEKTESKIVENQPVDPKDKKGRFKALIRDYGLTAVIFHITISLASLGICYLLVNSSIPMEKVFTWIGIDKKLGNLSDAASTSTNFVVAYAVHKSMALIRLSITAACVPVIVRYLRSKGILKPVVKVVKKVD